MVNSLFNAEKILGRTRNPWMDYAKGICIMMPVYRHTFEGIANIGVGSYSYPNLRNIDVFTMGFRMPLFFMIAGAFIATSLTRRGVNAFVNEKFKGVLYPLLVWGSIQITLQLLLSGTVNARRDWFDYFNLILDPRKLEQFWYLNALFFISVIYAFLSWHVKFTARHQLLLALILYSIASYCHINEIQIGFLSGVCFYYLFFAVGDSLKNIILDEKHHQWLSSFKTTAVLLPLFIAVEVYTMYVNLAHPEEFDFYVQHKRQDIFFFSSLVGTAMVVHLAFLLQRFNLLRFLRVVGYHALYIYLTHLIITAATRILLVNVLHIDNVLFLLFTIFASGIIGPIVFYNLARRFNFTWIFTLRDPNGAPSPKQPSAVYFSREAVMPKEQNSPKTL